ncbi:hypothetical protein ACGFRB_16765 [Streptomyces sp. NPDC048718]|uniref:hypothetical protein n=1 Tax=Streptomyces sp. NPDC048718 TaxID=3365587 RepID=UPI00371CB55F
MGSLRNPVGPLPSSIYWRRRAVALCLVALLALLGLWAVTSGGGGGKKTDDKANGASPAPAITPGPSGTGPAISQRPGGRDESDDDAGGDGGTGGGFGKDGSGSGSGADGKGAGSGGGSGDAGGKNGDTDGAGGDGGAGTGAGQRVPAGSSLPNCGPGSLQLTLGRDKNAYAPGEKPRFKLLVKNTGGADCKADLGPKNAVLTVRDTTGVLWSSKDCPSVATPLYFKVPAHSTITHTVEWDRHRSTPKCATAEKRGEVAPGTYLVEAAVPDAKVTPVSFQLTKD